MPNDYKPQPFDSGVGLSILQQGHIVAQRFALLQRLGRGGLGEVWEAEDTQMWRRVAIKLLLPHLAEDPLIVRRFLHEAQAAAKLNHPNVVLVHDIGRRRNGAYFIVQELLQGRDLRRHLDEKKQLTATEALDIFVPIMGGLVVVHATKIIHRDLKPENIFLAQGQNREIVPKLIDFGIAKVTTMTGFSDPPGLPAGAPNTTQGGQPGTLCYMSPEQFEEGDIDERTDVWSMGVVLYEMLAGQCPFYNKPNSPIVYQIIAEPAPRIEEQAPWVSPKLAEIVHRAIERDLSKRFDSIRSFLRALLDYQPSLASIHVRSLAGIAMTPAEAHEIDVPLDFDSIADTILPEVELSPSPPRAAIKSLWPHPEAGQHEGGPIPSIPEIQRHLDDANHALRINALGEAVMHAEIAVSQGALGEVLGQLRLIQAEALRWLGRYSESEAKSIEAMSQLRPGTDEWFQALGHLVLARGFQGKSDKLQEIASDLIKHRGSAASPWFIICATQVAIVAMRGGLMGLVDTLQALIPKHDDRKLRDAIFAWVNLLHAERSLHEGDPALYLRRVEAAVQSFSRARDVRNACYQHSNIGNAYMLLGAYERAERSLREAVTVGEQMKLNFVVAARVNLGLALSRMNRLDEARIEEESAITVCKRQGIKRLEAAARIYLAGIFSLQGDMESAEREVRAGITAASGSPSFLAYALATLAAILLQAGRKDEAFAPAKEAVDILERLDGAEEGESLIRLSYVRYLDAVGRRHVARERLVGARQRLLDRAALISDPDLRRSFLEEVPENAETMRLATRLGI